MTTELTARAYRRARAEGWPAVVALAQARRATTVPAWAHDLDDDGDGLWTGTVDGWQVRILAVEDDDPDISWIGTFTDRPDDAVPNPEYEAGRYRYFRPDRGLGSPEDLSRLGIPRHQRRQEWRRLAEAEARLALQPQYVITVEVQRTLGPTGTASLGGVFLEHAYDLPWWVDEHGLVAEAIEDAQATHVRECGNATQVCVAYGHRKPQLDAHVVGPVAVTLNQDDAQHEGNVRACLELLFGALYAANLAGGRVSDQRGGFGAIKAALITTVQAGFHTSFTDAGTVVDEAMCADGDLASLNRALAALANPAEPPY